jgi:hypothetical protein
VTATDWIADAERAGAELRETTRKAHEATRDLKAVVKEARELMPSIHEEFREVISRDVQEQLAAMGVEIGRARDMAVETTNKAFDKLAAILHGDDDAGPSIEEMVLAHRIACLIATLPGVSVKRDGSFSVDLDELLEFQPEGLPRGKHS